MKLLVEDLSVLNKYGFEELLDRYVIVKFTSDTSGVMVRVYSKTKEVEITLIRAEDLPVLLKIITPLIRDGVIGYD